MYHWEIVYLKQINHYKSKYELIIAGGSIEDVYYDAVDFFKSKNMDEHVIRLQYKMIQSQCELEINGNVHVSTCIMECIRYFTTCLEKAVLSLNNIIRREYY